MAHTETVCIEMACTAALGAGMVHTKMAHTETVHTEMVCIGTVCTGMAGAGTVHTGLECTGKAGAGMAGMLRAGMAGREVSHAPPCRVVCIFPDQGSEAHYLAHQLEPEHVLFFFESIFVHLKVQNLM